MNTIYCTIQSKQPSISTYKKKNAEKTDASASLIQNGLGFSRPRCNFKEKTCIKDRREANPTQPPKTPPPDAKTYIDQHMKMLIFSSPLILKKNCCLQHSNALLIKCPSCLLGKAWQPSTRTASPT
jgi:hypothetical protein